MKFSNKCSADTRSVPSLHVHVHVHVHAHAHVHAHVHVRNHVTSLTELPMSWLFTLSLAVYAVRNKIKPTINSLVKLIKMVISQAVKLGAGEMTSGTAASPCNLCRNDAHYRKEWLAKIWLARHHWSARVH